MPLLNVTLVPAPDQVVVRIIGDADLSSAPRIADGLDQAAELGTRQVVVDVAGMHFWDCSGLHVLIAFTAAMHAAGRSCRIVRAPARTRRLIQAADLTDRLNIDGPLSQRPVRSEQPVTEAVPDLPAMPARRPASGHPVPVRSRRPAMALTVRRRG